MSCRSMTRRNSDSDDDLPSQKGHYWMTYGTCRQPKTLGSLNAIFWKYVVGWNHNDNLRIKFERCFVLGDVLPVTAQRFGRCNGGKDISLRCDSEPQYGEVIPCFNMHVYVCWKHTYGLRGNSCRGHAQLLSQGRHLAISMCTTSPVSSYVPGIKMYCKV